MDTHFRRYTAIRDIYLIDFPKSRMPVYWYIIIIAASDTAYNIR